jgi:arylsulfatase A-like enzyme
MAMLKHLDDGVGDVVGKLKREGLFDNTILFFLTDNGGSKAMSADNTPLRGFKQMLDEGGIRTPFIVSWPDKFKGGRTVDTPIISFDILPTALDAVGEMPAKNDFAGKSLLPLLTGESKQHHDTLFWSKGPEDEWAVRRDDWKLHWTKGRMELVNLADDLSETKNLADSNADKVKELSRAYDRWIATMVDPITGGDRRKDESKKTTVSSEKKEMTPREIERERIREQRRAEKKAAK